MSPQPNIIITATSSSTSIIISPPPSGDRLTRLRPQRRSCARARAAPLAPTSNAFPSRPGEGGAIVGGGGRQQVAPALGSGTDDDDGGR
eukprot:scaffold1239_cov319-Prasinococcus_capsulatus_cf.AAC.1